MPTAVTLIVRSSAKGSRWGRHEVYASRDEAWVAITALQDRTAHVRLVEQEAEVEIPKPGIPDLKNARFSQPPPGDVHPTRATVTAGVMQLRQPLSW